MTTIPTGFAQVNMIFDGNGYLRGAQTTFGVDNNTALSATDAAAVVAANWIANMLPVQGSAINLKQVKWKNGPNDTGSEGIIDVAGLGSAAGNTLPPNVAVIAKKPTTLGGREHQGRMFVPGATESQTDGAGQLTDAALTAWISAAGDFYDQLVADDMPMFLLHNDATTPDEVLGLNVSRLMATQKRRLRKAGGRRSTP